MKDDYDVTPFSDGNGKLYQSANRSASYTWIRAGRTEVHLEERDVVYNGWMEQGEKADGVCLAWILNGEQSRLLRQDVLK